MNVESFVGGLIVGISFTSISLDLLNRWLDKRERRRDTPTNEDAEVAGQTP